MVDLLTASAAPHVRCVVRLPPTISTALSVVKLGTDQMWCWRIYSKHEVFDLFGLGGSFGLCDG